MTRVIVEKRYVQEPKTKIQKRYPNRVLAFSFEDVKWWWILGDFNFDSFVEVVCFLQESLCSSTVCYIIFYWIDIYHVLVEKELCIVVNIFKMWRSSVIAFQSVLFVDLGTTIWSVLRTQKIETSSLLFDLLIYIYRSDDDKLNICIQCACGLWLS